MMGVMKAKNVQAIRPYISLSVVIFRFSRGEAFAPADSDGLLSRSFDSVQFHSWKGDMEIELCSRGLYRVTMDTKDEPGSAI